ncbi:ubiquitin carboxyl-terminal hydrolase, putative [Babesia caballi]|uniref:ubiquitinyl hydrolase 1 n=1 Tax=Babesia caballi TaxID=5871 RepID=A0AAV4LYV8_BABCB|nr:ubiquitin carboxyl-terminal hydrolase, putative [Babesia caballi]
MLWHKQKAASDAAGVRLPPLSANEVEFIVRDFKGTIVEPLVRLLREGDPNDEIKELHNMIIYSDWKDLPNFRFRIMLFPVCPHSTGGSELSDFRLSTYVEAARKEDWPDSWACYGTRFCVFIINHRNLQFSIYKKDAYNFSNVETDRGWQGILSLSQVLEEGFLNENGDLVMRGGAYPMGAEVNRASRDSSYNCRKATGFVGLQNHGATCYMNALLQSLYSITKFRKAVYMLNFRIEEIVGQKSYEIMKRLEHRLPVHLPPTALPVEGFKNSKRKSHESSDSPVEDESVCDDPTDSFFDNELDDRDCCAITMDEEAEQTRVPCVGLALQNLFYKLKYAPSAPPCKELMRSFGWDSSDMFTQQDSHELLKLLLDKMEEQMKGTPVEGSVKQMFEGEMETYIECIDIDYKSCRMETFEDIQLDIQGCSDIYESLKKLTEAEILSGDNMYEAEGHGKQRARKGIRFVKFPPVCVFLLKRFTFDLQRMDTVKLNDRFEFYKEIDLSPFAPNGGKYVLQAVSVHQGSINSGHYYAFAASDKGEWYRFDDEVVCKVSEYAVIGDNFGGEEPECFNYLASDDDVSIRPFRRSKTYNAYILIYVLKSAVGDILGDCDPVKEKYSMIARCRMQERLATIRQRVRERRDQYIKVKMFFRSDFQGCKPMDQPYSNWACGKVVTFERSTTLAEATRHIANEAGSTLTIESFALENFHIMGFSRLSQRFCCLADIRSQQQLSTDTLQSLVTQMRRDAFQVYDPTLHILYLPRPPRTICSSMSYTLLFVKYFDIFDENPSAESLVCLDLVYVSPDRSIAQVSAMILRTLFRFMGEGRIVAHSMDAIERCASRIESVDASVKTMRELDATIEQILLEGAIHFNWYVELSNQYDTVAPNKTLRDQHFGNGDSVVFNFRPTESMRSLVEETGANFNRKEDFEPTCPVAASEWTEPLFHISPDYLASGEVTGLEVGSHSSAFKELQGYWAQVAASEISKYEKLTAFPIYDYPSFIDWRLNVATVTVRLFNPLEQLGAWVNCCDALVKPPASTADASAASFDDSQVTTGAVKTMKFTFDLRLPCKHALRHISWSMGVDPAHVLFYGNNPHKLDSVWMNPVSVDDFCHRDSSLGFMQKPLSDLFPVLGKAVRSDAELTDRMMRTSSLTSNAQCSDRSVDNPSQVDSSATDVESYPPGLGTSGVLALPSASMLGCSLGSLDSRGDSNRDSARTDPGALPLAGNPPASSSGFGAAKQSNTIYMAVFPKCYRDMFGKGDATSLRYVVQVFNHRVECIGVCMGSAPIDATVAQVCDTVARTFKAADPVKLRMIEILSNSFVLAEPAALMSTLPLYANVNVRNLLAAPLRVEPDWTDEELELLERDRRRVLTVMHQTPDHETFGHPFQILVDPQWTLGEIKSAIKEKLGLPKREWDRWSFFQQMEGYSRVWKANDDYLDWDRSSAIKLIAEHPKPYDKSRSFSAMRIA